ncbi:MAG TPA: LacI family DNA-binding transcriptional regulator [Candidatus Aphodoplasma excrementigallinarum]|uniref:LacI family DNA-binding transcriptional regulator n=1 Tax=Candidatus Aphodoplasma excrementigallinarum TaxID=2840673 RepID=A0A9D1NFM1_9FIRM|nr:LacI family DNA-binding transcriptional regulator [Candidatus Aphodoplasma excrementigallinarum]
MKIKEIAERAGVSQSTVSRVIHNSGYVSAEARSRIEAVMKETGFRPGSVKPSKEKRTYTVGVVVPQLDAELLSRLVQQITLSCQERGYHVILANMDMHPEREVFCIRELCQHKVEGIIAISMGITQEHIQIAKRLAIPLVIIGQQDEALCCVTHDDYKAGRDAADFLIERQCRNFGLVSVEKKERAANARCRGFYDFVYETYRGAEVRCITEGNSSEASGYEAAKTVCEGTDAVFCATDQMACGVLRYMKENQIHVPEVCSIMGVGNHCMSQVISPQLTTIEYFQETIGALAVEKLFLQMESGKKEVGVTYVPYTIIERGTTRDEEGNHNDR